jgi:small subunit ribosomal protein S2
MKSALQREMDKIKANLEGIRKMERLPGLMVIIDTRREHIAVKEAKKLGVTTIALIDTDSDPDLIDLPIPGNDDAMRAIEIIMHELADSVIEGKSGRGELKQEEQPRRRSTRAAFRADEGGKEEGGAPDAAADATTDAAAEPAPATGEPVAAGQG